MLLVNPIPQPEVQGGYDTEGNFSGGMDDKWIEDYNEAESKVLKGKLLLIEKIK